MSKYRRKALESIALALQDGRDVHDALIECLHQVVGWRVQDATEEADDVLKILAQQRAGLVVRRGDRYEFVHPSFCEYLSAASLVQACGSDTDKVWSRGVSRWREDQWREVSLFALDVLSDENKDVTPLLEQIWEEGESGLYFSGTALADQVRVRDDLASQIINALLAKGRRLADPDLWYVIEVLSRLGAYALVVEGLLTLARDETVETWVRAVAAELLGEVGRVDHLLSLARDETVDTGVRVRAATALGKLGRTDDAVPILLTLARDETVATWVRAEAAELLGIYGDARLLPDLERIAQQDADWSVRGAARAAVEQIRQRLSGKLTAGDE